MEEAQILTCKAAICWKPGEPLSVEEIRVEPPRALEVRVKMICASICHTDVLFWRGFPLELFPRILGHEGVGVIESVGEGVQGLKVGDTIIPVFIGECGECSNCRSEKTNICLKHPVSFSGLMADQTSRMSVNGQKLYHCFSCSTFSEYMVVNSNFAVKVNPTVAPPLASFLSCGFSTGFGAVWKEAGIQEGSSVAVFGLGGVGLGAIAGAKVSGASKVIGVDLNELKRPKAEVFGMTDFINPNELHGRSIAEKIREMTGGLGVDYSFECTGIESLINEALDATKPGCGMTVVVGTTKQTLVPVNFLELLKGKTLKGSLFGGIKPQSHLPEIFARCANKEFELDSLATHQVSLDDINQAFQLLKERDCLKVVVNMETEASEK